WDKRRHCPRWAMTRSSPLLSARQNASFLAARSVTARRLALSVVPRLRVTPRLGETSGVDEIVFDLANPRFEPHQAFRELGEVTRINGSGQHHRASVTLRDRDLSQLRV